ncbi:MAG TPA: hypothetical protein VFQ65_05020 [Kofleriaceae bacterium]|nr:hypothetical protein [Kofleriaceae bacterium]
MTAPLTRRDLEEVLDQRLADYPTRAELRETLRTALANHPTHAQLAESLAQLRKELRAEIADDTRTTMTVLLEDAFKRFRVIDDQYKDLPGRVAKLEQAVFPPPRARRKRSA